jgi:hypothetical protein
MPIIQPSDRSAHHQLPRVPNGPNSARATEQGRSPRRSLIDERRIPHRT